MDALRELVRADKSGFDGWAIINGVFTYFKGLWTMAEVAALNINILKFATLNMATFTFLDHAEACNFKDTLTLEVTNNEAAEFCSDRGRLKKPQMHEFLRRRTEELCSRRVTSASTHIASVDNDIADDISRGGEMLGAALRIATSAGLPIRCLAVSARWRDLSDIISL